MSWGDSPLGPRCPGPLRLSRPWPGARRIAGAGRPPIALSAAPATGAEVELQLVTAAGMKYGVAALEDRLEVEQFQHVTQPAASHRAYVHGVDLGMDGIPLLHQQLIGRGHRALSKPAGPRARAGRAGQAFRADARMAEAWLAHGLDKVFADQAA